KTAAGKFAISLSFAPGDARVLAAGFSGVQVLAPRSGSVVYTIQPPTNDGFSAAAAYSPDGSTIASVDFNGFLRLTNAATGKPERRPLPVSQVGLNSVGWSPDGRTIVTSDWEGAVRLTDVATGKQIGTAFQAPEPDAPFPHQTDDFTQW